MLSTRAWILTALVVASASVARGQSTHRYELSARLDPSTHQVTGRVTIHWRNDSSAAVDHLMFHLYLNAFASDDTVFMTESGGQLRGTRFHGHGSIELQTLTVDGSDVLSGADDELVPGDHTQLRVPLPEPVAPGETRVVEANFVSTLPPVFARSGYHGDFHMVAQWFPKLATLEPDGTWSSFPYHGNGEFYADFADYTLEVDTPVGWEVGATGERVAETTRDDRVVRRFHAARVHDAAFATAPWFRERSAEYRGEDGTSVQVRVLYPPGYGAAVDRHVEVTLGGLRRYGRLLGEYPYPTLTVIVPPRGADGAAGMEYPTLFVTAGPWWRFGGAPMALHDEVTAHELGHQWFQGMVATNEVRFPMLDEGLTEWITSDYLQAMHGRGSGLNSPLPRISSFELHRFSAFRGFPTAPPNRPAHRFRRGTYGRAVYSRSAVVLETVARTWGRARFHRALGAYAREQRFRHPVPEDLYRAFDAEYGPWMSRRVLRPALDQGAFASRHATLIDGHARGLRWGDLPLPTRVDLWHRDGRQSVESWPGRDVAFSSQADDVVALAIDAQRHGLLDPDRRDDMAREGAPPASPIGRVLYLFQALVAWLGP